MPRTAPTKPSPAALLLALALLACCSCVNTRQATYFSGVGEAQFTGAPVDLEPTLQPNDLLSISVSSLSPEAAQMFNAGNRTAAQASTASGASAQAAGYLIDQQGNIRFPVLGAIPAAGLTKKALREDITARLVRRKLLLEPVVDVRYLNYRVSVLGEVARPSVLTIPSERVTLLEALGLAGDLTIYAKRDNVLLIREEAGVRRTARIDLTSHELLTSPYYYLRSNDIVYVEPNKSRIASSGRANQWLPVVMSSLSLAVIALDRLLR